MWYRFVIILLIFSSAINGLVQNTQPFEMEKPISGTRRWTQRISGLCGQRCRNGPRLVYSTSFQDKFIVGWSAVGDSNEPSNTWLSHGYVSTFQVSDNGVFTHIKDIQFPQCQEIAGITASKNGSVIGVLCIGQKDAPLLKEAFRFIDLRKKSPDCNHEWQGQCYPIGWYSDIDQPLYLFEYTGGQVTATSNNTLLINHAIGGWRYGHQEIALNNDATIYFADIKCTAGPSLTNRHEGSTHFGIRRVQQGATITYEYTALTDGWACGSGHTEYNRITYNQAANRWARICKLDASSKKNFHSMRWGTVPYDNVPEPEILLLDVSARSRWIGYGGPGGIISLGNSGWMVIAVGTGINGSANDVINDKIGIMKLPVYHKDNSANQKWIWLNLQGQTFSTNKQRFGLPHLMNFDKGGEQSQRILLGYSPATGTQGIADEYVVQELDLNGKLVGNSLVLNNAGFGGDSLWAYVPQSGCVAMAHSWVGQAPGNGYPINGRESIEKFPNKMYLTSICPAGSTPQPPTNPDNTQPANSKYCTDQLTQCTNDIPKCNKEVIKCKTLIERCNGIHDNKCNKARGPCYRWIDKCSKHMIQCARADKECNNSIINIITNDLKSDNAAVQDCLAQLDFSINNVNADNEDCEQKLDKCDEDLLNDCGDIHDTGRCWNTSERCDAVLRLCINKLRPHKHLALKCTPSS